MADPARRFRLDAPESFQIGELVGESKFDRSSQRRVDFLLQANNVAAAARPQIDDAIGASVFHQLGDHRHDAEINSAAVELMLQQFGDLVAKGLGKPIQILELEQVQAHLNQVRGSTGPSGKQFPSTL